MTHLITGGSGFVGEHLAARLTARGDSVRILDVWNSTTRPGNAEFLQGSIVDRDRVAAAMRGVDVVHHHAALVAQAGIGAQYREINVDGARIVAEEAAKTGVKTVVHVSTTAVFGIAPSMPIDGRTPLRPVEPYGRSKLAGEDIMSDICRQNGIRLVTIRPRVVLGGGRLGIFQILFDWIRDGRNIHIIGNGSNRQQFVHVDDLLDFYMLALDNGVEGAFNVGAGSFGTLGSDIAGLIEHAGSSSQIRHLPPAIAVNALRALYHLRLSPLVPWHYLTYHRDCYFDTSPLLRMGWKPKYANIDMLRESYDWFCATNPAANEASSPHRTPVHQGVLRLLKRAW